MPKNVFVSLPMTGKTEEQMYEAFFERCSEYIRNHPGEETYFHCNIGVKEDDIRDISCKPGLESLAYLSIALQQMAKCDEVIFHKDWEKSKGCKVEKLIYELYFEK